MTLVKIWGVYIPNCLVPYEATTFVKRGRNAEVITRTDGTTAKCAPNLIFRQVHPAVSGLDAA